MPDIPIIGGPWHEKYERKEDRFTRGDAFEIFYLDRGHLRWDIRVATGLFLKYYEMDVFVQAWRYRRKQKGGAS